MGYILPITHYSYINYEHRMRKSNKSPHYVDKPFKVVLDERGSDIDREQYNYHPKSHFKKAVHVKRHVKAGLTGKGQKINVGI